MHYIAGYEIKERLELRVGEVIRLGQDPDEALAAMIEDVRAWAKYTFRFNLPTAERLKASDEKDLSRDLVNTLDITYPGSKEDY